MWGITQIIEKWFLFRISVPKSLIKRLIRYSLSACGNRFNTRHINLSFKKIVGHICVCSYTALPKTVSLLQVPCHLTKRSPSKR